MLPIGQQLWTDFFKSMEKFPPLQAPESYNISQIVAQFKAQRNQQPSRLVPRGE